MEAEKKENKKEGALRSYSSDSVTAISLARALLRSVLGWVHWVKDTRHQEMREVEAVVVPRKVSCGGGVTYYCIKQILAFFVCPFSATWERSTIITDMQEHLAKRNACHTRQIGKG